MSDHNASENTGPNASRPVVGKLDEKDLSEAARIVRLAFGTFLGAPDPETFWADRDYVYGRQRAAHVASFGATLDGKLVGSNFATNWGSVGFFGPLTVRPDLQERGIAPALLAKAMARFPGIELLHGLPKQCSSDNSPLWIWHTSQWTEGAAPSRIGGKGGAD